MKLFNKFNEEEILKLYEAYSLSPTIIVVESQKPSEDLILLLETLLKNRPLFENKKKFLKISEEHLYEYLLSIAAPKKILLKNKLSYYDKELIGTGLLKIKVGSRFYYVAK